MTRNRLRKLRQTRLSDKTDAMLPLAVSISYSGGNSREYDLWFLSHLLLQRTRFGKAMSATVQNPAAAQLMGIDIRGITTAAFAMSGFLAGVAGIMVAPLFSVSSTMGTLFGIKAFAVAILGGIASAWGVVLAGLIYGCIEALITALLGSTYTQILSFALVILVLVLRPNGLFGRPETRKV